MKKSTTTRREALAQIGVLGVAGTTAALGLAAQSAKAQTNAQDGLLAKRQQRGDMTPMTEKVYEELLAAMSQWQVINTHSHHYWDDAYRGGFSLKKLINSSYVAWVHYILDHVQVPDASWFDALRSNNAFHWLERGIQQLHKTDLTISRDSFAALSKVIEDAHRDESFHWKALQKVGYQKIVMDCYWNSGNNHGHPEVFTPAYRVNMFYQGYSRTARCHNGFNPYEFLKMEVPGSIDEYCQKVFAVLQRAKEQGAVALKSAVAYDRGLDFLDCDKAVADKALLRGLREEANAEDINHFQGYMMNRLCEMAVQLDFPFQIHTGLGKMVRSNAMWLQPTIEKHPNTQFMLLHGSFPWCEDIIGLAHRYWNVKPDICWMPILSTSVTERFLDGLLEVGRADGICWGCDTWTTEESLGALLAAREVVAKVLSAKITSGRIDKDAALRIAKAIFFDNANRFYFKNRLVSNP